MNRLLLCFFVIFLTSCVKQAQAIPKSVRLYGFTRFTSSGNGRSDVGGKFFNEWAGVPIATSLLINVGWESPKRSDPRTVTSQDQFKGILVRVRAFDAAGKPAGEINGRGLNDDTFFTGRKCSFTPSKPGTYRLSLEVLDERQKPIPMKTQNQWGEVSKEVAKSNVIYLVFEEKKEPRFLIQCDNWSPAADNANLYSRQVHIYHTDWRLRPGGPGILGQETWSLQLQASIVPPFPIHHLEKVSWFSPSGKITLTSTRGQASITQYFRYDPARDLPRNADLFTVKLRVLP